MMKNLVRFLAVGVVFAALSLAPLAQNAPAGTSAEKQGMNHGMPSVEERVQHLTNALNLTTDQQAKVKSILEDQKNQMVSLKQDTSLSKQDRHAKLQATHQDTRQKIQAVLTDDQKAKFEQMQALRKEHMGMHSQEDTGSPSKQ